MKKRNIILSVLFAAVGLTSCDMEKYPYNAVEESQYMTTANDFKSARIGLYSPYRTLTSGGHILTPEFQCADFHATASYSNTYGNQYRWDFQSSDGNIEAIWGNFYTLIARSNYYIDSYQKLVNGEIPGISEADRALIDCWAGEAYFSRAFAYYNLATFFCEAYDPSTAAEVYGLPLQLTYVSNATDNSQYPGRSSLQATFEQINKDLAEAERLVNENKTVNSNTQAKYNYISQDLVTALRARIALWTKDYDTAISASTALISSNKYPLINDGEAFRAMWVTDYGTEVIWQIYTAAPDELCSTNGTMFWGQYKNGDPQVMDFIPSQSLIDLYTDGDKDIRFTSFFAPYHLALSNGSEADVYVFDKCPGNPDIYSQTIVDNHYINKPKPFRIAEQYLIAAEAYAAKNDVTNASKYLNDLCRTRIAEYVDKNYTNATILTAIQNERHKELVGEGFQLIDLKRWNLGIDRANAYQESTMVLQPGGVNTTALSKQAGDDRFVWPIPKAEYDANPQLKGQQNPGY